MKHWKKSSRFRKARSKAKTKLQSRRIWRLSENLNPFKHGGTKEIMLEMVKGMNVQILEHLKKPSPFLQLLNKQDGPVQFVSLVRGL